MIPDFSKEKEKSNCFSCGICQLKCPKQCITLQKDSRGFSYPVIDRKQCIRCDLCSNICPAIHADTLKKEPADHVYALVSTNQKIFENASSGGAFMSIVKAFFEKGGDFVFGAVIDDTLKVKHEYHTSFEDCFCFCRSKYVKSDMADCFWQAKSFLDIGKRTLFSGTPCQIAALRKYLGKEYENLFTVDCVCGGVPGAFFFEKFIQQSKEKITAVNFRASDGGNKRNIEYIYENAEKKLFSADKDRYLQAFWLNLTQMESCFHCPFSDVSRCSDITLGDFWGVEKASSTFRKGDGVSLVIVNSPKGEELFGNLSQVCTETHSIQTAVEGNPRLQSPLKKNPRAQEFAKRLKIGGESFNSAYDRVTRRTIGNRVIAKVKRMIKAVFKK